MNEQYEVLQRGIAIHKRLERLVLEERGLDEVVRALAATTGGAVWVLSARGETIAATRFRRQVPEAALEYVREEVRRRSGGLGGAARDWGRPAPEGCALTRRSSSRPTIPRSPGAPWCSPSRSAGAAARRRGSWPRATPAGWATSSGSSCSRP